MRSIRAYADSMPTANDGDLMNTITKQPSVKDDGQREALKESEKKATEQQPESFKDVATDEKLVEIGPDVTDAPIKGIDPPERSASGR